MSGVLDLVRRNVRPVGVALGALMLGSGAYVAAVLVAEDERQWDWGAQVARGRFEGRWRLSFEDRWLHPRWFDAWRELELSTGSLERGSWRDERAGGARKGWGAVGTGRLHVGDGEFPFVLRSDPDAHGRWLAFDGGAPAHPDRDGSVERVELELLLGATPDDDALLVRIVPDEGAGTYRRYELVGRGE